MSGLFIVEEMYPVCISCRDCGESFLAYANAVTGKHRTRCDKCCQTVGGQKLTVTPPWTPDPGLARKIADLKRKSVPERLSGVLREWADVFARLLALGAVFLLIGLVLRGLWWIGGMVASFAG